MFLDALASATATCSVPDVPDGSLLIAVAFNNNVTPAPILDGWAESCPPVSRAGAALTICHKVKAGETEVTFADGTASAVVAFDDFDSSDPIGASLSADGNSGVVTIPGLSLEVTDGSATVISFYGHRNSPGGYPTPAGMVERFEVDGGGSDFLAGSTAEGVSSFAGTTVTAGGSANWASVSLEIKGSGGGTTVPPNEGSVSGALTLTGSVDGSAPAVAPHSGSAEGILTLGGTVEGRARHAGDVAGTLSLTGSAAGSAPAVPLHSGDVSGALRLSGGATGDHPVVGVHRGNVDGTLHIFGGATGDAPTVDHNTGDAAGALRLFGGTQGNQPAITPNSGEVSGTIRLFGGSTGSQPLGDGKGDVSGTLRLFGGATGGHPFAAQIPAISAEALKNRLGTRIFPSFAGRTGEKLLDDDSWITNLGAPWVSHRLQPDIPADVVQFIKDLAAKGVKSVLAIGEPHHTFTTNEWDTMEAILADLAGSVWMVLGQNEVNHARGSETLPADWANIAATNQAELWTRVQALNATLAPEDQILVGSPSLWSGSIPTHDADLTTLAPLIAGNFDVVNWHLYPRGVDPNWNIDHFQTVYQAEYGQMPVICSEAGYFDAVNYTGGAVPVSEATAAVYLLKLWLEYASRGYWVSIFELLDDPDPTLANREDNLGIVETPSLDPATWTAKDAYTLLQSVLSSLSGGHDGSVGALVTAPEPVQTLAVNTDTGTMLFLWRRVDIEQDFAPIAVDPIEVTIQTVTGSDTVLVAGNVETYVLDGEPVAPHQGSVEGTLVLDGTVSGRAPATGERDIEVYAVSPPLSDWATTEPVAAEIPVGPPAPTWAVTTPGSDWSATEPENLSTLTAEEPVLALTASEPTDGWDATEPEL